MSIRQTPMSIRQTGVTDIVPGSSEPVSGLTAEILCLAS
jgi:hypothetical protein